LTNAKGKAKIFKYIKKNNQSAESALKNLFAQIFRKTAQKQSKNEKFR
jgi:hypothetical protein